MNPTEHLLQCLQEECAEIIKDCSKANRFGLDDRNILEPEGPTNRERIVAELNDLIGVIELCIERGIVPKGFRDGKAIDAKKAKVLKFMAYAKTVGALNTTRSYPHQSKGVKIL